MRFFDHLKHPLISTACVCMLLLTSAVWYWIVAQRNQPKETREYIGTWASQNVLPAVNGMAATVNGLPDKLIAEIHSQGMELQKRADARLGSLGASVNARVEQALKLADGRLGEALGKADHRIDQAIGEASGQIRELRGDLRPLIDGAVKLENEYAALPDRLALELQPAWRAIEPEFTCRKADGTGLGACWHASITGLLNEAKDTGAIFRQEFPPFAQSLNGIASDGHAWTNKYVLPHPMTFGQKLKAAGKFAIGVGGIYVRAGGGF